MEMTDMQGKVPLSAMILICLLGCADGTAISTTATRIYLQRVHDVAKAIDNPEQVAKLLGVDWKVNISHHIVNNKNTELCVKAGDLKIDDTTFYTPAGTSKSDLTLKTMPFANVQYRSVRKIRCDEAIEPEAWTIDVHNIAGVCVTSEYLVNDGFSLSDEDLNFKRYSISYPQKGQSIIFSELKVGMPCMMSLRIQKDF